MWSFIDDLISVLFHLAFESREVMCLQEFVK